MGLKWVFRFGESRTYPDENTYMYMIRSLGLRIKNRRVNY